MLNKLEIPKNKLLSPIKFSQKITPHTQKITINSII